KNETETPLNARGSETSTESETKVRQRPLPPVKDRRYVFIQRIAAGMKPRMAAQGLFLNSAREAKRPEAVEAIAAAKAERIQREVDRLAAAERKKALQDARSRALEPAGEPAARPTSNGPSMDAVAA